MAAFDRVSSGIPEMDTALDNIRLGDNVVFRVSNLSEFKLFVDPYIGQAKRDKRNIIYFRFASHEPLVDDCPEVKTYPVPLTHRFETFTMDIHNIIEKEGKDAFYVFDCLSELQIRWATDLMMGNFFRVTCPFLFILDTVAFFPIIRGRHSFHSIQKILNTTQLFLDVYSDSQNVYVRPEKVWNRDSETMFLPHIYKKDDGTFRPILDGVRSSRFYQLLDNFQRPGEDQYMDFWDKFFNTAKVQYDSQTDMTESCNMMCNIMMTRDEKMRQMVKKHFKPEDYFAVRNHMIGTGMIGGKACGMLLARAIIRNMSPEINEVLEPHDSFFMGSDIYYTYIVDNEFWNLRIRQRTVEAMDVSEHALKRLDLKEIESKLPMYLVNTLLEHDYEVEDSLKERGIYRDVRFISCRGLVKKQIIMTQMQQMMQLIQKEYDHPVDIEFTMNLSESGEYSINLLQCRPLQVFKDTGNVAVPTEVSDEEIILETVDSSMGLSRSVPIDLVVYVDPKAYYNMPYADKARIARAIGKVNWTFRGQDRHMMLLVPGRIGTSSQELGVPTTFADISDFEVVCEVEEKEAGYNPELSYGSHIFQDLVEADILYTAVFANEKTLHFSPDKLWQYRNFASDFIENDSDADIVKVFDLKGNECTLFYDLEKNHLLLKN